MLRTQTTNTLIALLLTAGLFSAPGCKRKDNIIVDPPPPPFSYFKFKFEGTSHNLNFDFPQYMPFYANEAGGYQVANSSLAPSVGLRLSWPEDDTVSESNLMALEGKTLYFSDTTVHPTLTYTTELGGTDWRSVDTNNTAYNVKITKVVFFKKDTSAGNPLKTYIIKGTCNALMSKAGTMSTFSEGEFNFVISRRDL
jgi:hypothetical protein